MGMNVDGCMHGCVDTCKNGRMNRWMGVGWVQGQMTDDTEGQIYRAVEGWMGELVNGQMDGEMYECMDGQTNRKINELRNE